MLVGRVLMRRVHILVIQGREKSLHKNWLNFLLLLLFLASGFGALRPLFLARRCLPLLFFLLLGNLHQLLLLVLESLKFLYMLLLFGQRKLLLFLASLGVLLHELGLLLFVKAFKNVGPLRILNDLHNIERSLGLLGSGFFFLLAGGGFYRSSCLESLVRGSGRDKLEVSSFAGRELRSRRSNFSRLGP